MRKTAGDPFRSMGGGTAPADPKKTIPRPPTSPVGSPGKGYRSGDSTSEWGDSRKKG